MSKIKINYDNLFFLKKENIFNFSTNNKGKKILILGGVHGDEIAGIKAIENIIKKLIIDNGEIYFIICNDKAIKKKERFIEENLNRCFLKNKVSTNSYEENLANELKPIMSQFDICLDIHNSTSKDTEPFIICEANAYPLINSINVKKVVSNFDKLEPGGTDYFMNSINKIGICIECGYLDDKNSVQVAENIIINFLKKTCNIKESSKNFDEKKYYFLDKTYIPKINFVLEKKFKDFEKIKLNQIIGYDNENIIYSTNNSIILFAKNLNNNYEEAFLTAKEISIKDLS